MTRSRNTLSPETHALFDVERAIPPQPAAVRARAIARARAALETNAWLTAVPAVFVGRVSRRPRWAAAAVLVCVASAALAATGYGIRAYLKPAPRTGPGAPPVEIIAPARPRSRPAVSILHEGFDEDLDEGRDESVLVPSTTPRPHGSPTDAMRDELRLLRRARAAVAREDFGAALPPIAEHTRRYRNGRLAEEREALRVKTLVGLGRTEQARRAAGSFRVRFPHSVLLPAVSQMPASPPP